MSKEAVDRMMQAAGADATLQQQLESAGGFAEVVQIGADKGYQFTAEDAQVFLRERGIPIGDSGDGELSEEALEAVAGGGWGWTDNVRINIRAW
jgi:predicted ribosomally synthesized peptide with nif11-like leader